MRDRLIMHVSQGLDGISEILSGFLRLQHVLLSQVVEERASAHVLQDQVYVVSIFEEAVELDDVWVVEGAMEPDLSFKLLHHLVLNKLRFNDLLQSHNETSLNMTGQIHLSKFALPQLLRYAEPLNSSIALPSGLRFDLSAHLEWHFFRVDLFERGRGEEAAGVKSSTLNPRAWGVGMVSTIFIVIFFDLGHNVAELGRMVCVHCVA